MSDGLQKTINEAVAMRNSISHLTIPTPEYVESVRKALEPVKHRVLTMLAESSYGPQHLDSLQEALDIARAGMIAVSADAIPYLSNGLDVLARTLAEAREFLRDYSRLDNHHETEEELSLDLDSQTQILSSIDQARSYMTPEQAVTANALAPKIKPKLSLDTKITLISLFLTLLFGLIALLPDKQLDRIIEQNDQSIALEQQQLEQGNELLSAIGSIQESLSILVDEIDDASDEPSGEPSGESSMEAGDCHAG